MLYYDHNFYFKEGIPMATKKASSAKKTTKSKSLPVKSTVTTVKAVEAAKSKTSWMSDRRTVLASALIAEFIGTFLLTGAFLVTRGEPLYMGFVLITLVLMVGTLSGAHLNPLITVGAWVTRKVSHLRAGTYIVAQLLGAGAAFVVLNAFVHATPVDASAAAYGSQAATELYKLATLTDANHWFVFFAELLGATVFAFAVAGARREKNDRVAKAMAIGFGLFVAALIAGVAAGYVKANVALNPAIALAASAVNFTSVDWFSVAVYLVAPLLGGVIGFALRDVVETTSEK